MAVPVLVPRINNNDDVVKVVAISVAVGAQVKAGDVVGQVETDKAIIDIEAAADGYIIGVVGVADEEAPVGGVFLWIGKTADEKPPEQASVAAPQSVSGTAGVPTAKAQMLLARHGLLAETVPHSGDRLTAADVERHLAAKGRGKATAGAQQAAHAADEPDVPGVLRDLRNDERGMLHTVSWSRANAVPGYIELEYDPAPWERYAKVYADRHRLMLSPLLSLMCWRLVQLAVDLPRLNATIVRDRRHEYVPVNLGFTVQAGETLYITVVRDAGAQNEVKFVNTMGDLQRRAAAHKLVPDEMIGATISFSSMARWKVSRHIPILPPHTALIVAHAVSASGVPVLGATYDHRVLNGFQVVSTLRKLGKPPGDEQT